ncbi:cupin domain-containing protein [Corallococcus sp. BB11-1]|uniref:cupin domain-containing protein n=1 Tax=Corallococcus sp. BB11-1 TaxID=2996783 RepID=UPI00226F4A47|nr:cupin domain-containing protein [Corallococcus sp. BB11-1]MCY1029889.1 cupin domain-containing protein [Corallococcus sp. BB11-1]
MSTPTRTSPPIGGRPPRWDSRRRGTVAVPAEARTPTADDAGTPPPPLEKVNLAHAFTHLSGPDTPQPVGMLHGQPVHLVRLTGNGPWCQHATGDALFFVTRGHLRVELRERSVDLEAGELLIVPRGVEHRSVTASEALVLVSAPTHHEDAGQSPPP